MNAETIPGMILNSEPDRMMLTADVVVAFVGRNDIAPERVPELISSVFNAFTSLGGAVQAEEVRPEPAVPIRKSVTPDHIICLEDGAKLKMLKRYIRTNYDMSPEEYRKRWDLPSDYPMTAPNYTEKRRQLAKDIGLGTKAIAGRGRKRRA